MTEPRHFLPAPQDALAMVIGGSRTLVWGASGIARSFGLSEWVIGVTVVAAGTSAPEVVTSLTAVLKGKHGISAGGLIGSDIYNLLGVLGLAAAISPMSVASTAPGSVLLLVAMVMLTLIFMRSGWKVGRAEQGPPEPHEEQCQCKELERQPSTWADGAEWKGCDDQRRDQSQLEYSRCRVGPFLRSRVGTAHRDSRRGRIRRRRWLASRPRSSCRRPRFRSVRSSGRSPIPRDPGR